MNKYVALLRGINVGGNCKVEMSKLKKMFETLGFSDVSTYINSGNVVFSSALPQSADIKSKIEKALHKTFGFEIKTLVKSKSQILKLCKNIPTDWLNDSEQRTDVLFLWDNFDKKESVKLILTNKDVDILKYTSGAIVWHLLKKDYTKSRMNRFIGTELYKNMTGRNINTVRKLAEMMKRN